MLVRVMSCTMALLCFGVVCFTGLLQGNSFASVIKGSLLALGVGAIVGVFVATIVRVVVEEHFRRQHPREEVDKPPSEQAGLAPRSAQADASGGAQPGSKEVSESPAGVGN